VKFSGCRVESTAITLNFSKTSTPLSYIFQAAMGQCSTLPANDEMHEQLNKNHNDHQSSGKHTGLDFNALVTAEQSQKPARKAFRAAQPQTAVLHFQQQQRDPEPMDFGPLEPMREEAPPPIPNGAVRTRCYKLNLDSEINLTSTQRQQIFLGPFTEPPPFLTYTSSEDSESSATAVAIQTAQIFRGITVARDGTILSQNARATRSNRGNKTKQGEKSRQAAKIDKANDLVDEAIANGTGATEDEAAKLVSLIVVGEYDDMKQLVRDGSRKLREAEGLPDEALLQINRARANSKIARTAPRLRSSRLGSATSSMASSPTPLTPVVAQQQPQQQAVTVSSTPKLKSNPRDTGRRTREMRLDAACNDFIKRGDNDNDWGHAWNIWNCGGAGTVSPLQPSSPNRMEARNDVISHRENAMSSRVG
jgi:hypothetical protein